MSDNDREIATYILGSFIIAAIGCFGIVFMIGGTWLQGLGATMVVGIILSGVTLKDRQENRF